MKFLNDCRSKSVFPDATTVCDLIVHLERPFHIMAWMMAETAARMADLQALRVSDVSRENKSVQLLSGLGVRSMGLSDGLVDAIVSYLAELREHFEKNKRWNLSSHRSVRADIPMFSDQLLFPAWILPGYARAPLQESIPAAEYVRALQTAAHACEYHGMIQSNTMRLFCTSRWMAQGLDVLQLHAKLGHRDIMTTMLMVQALRSGGLTFAATTELPAISAPASLVA